MSRLAFLFLLLSGSSAVVCFAQNGDSIIRQSHHLLWQDKSQPDTIRLEALKQDIWENYIFADGDSARILNQIQLDLATETNNQKYSASAYNTTGIIFYLEGALDSAYIYMERALEINKTIGEGDAAASNRTNLASVLTDMALYDEAINYYFESLTQFESSGNLFAESQTLINIGLLYDKLGYYDLAIDYLQKSEDRIRESGDTSRLLPTYVNLAAVYRAADQFDKSYATYQKAYHFADQNEDKSGLAAVLGGLGKCEFEMGNVDQALAYHKQSLAIYENTTLDHHTISELNEIGKIYQSLKDYETALDYCLQALDYAVAMEDNVLMQQTMETLHEIYYELGDYEESLKMFSISVGLKDSIRQIENRDAILKQNYQYEYDKRALIDSIKFENKSQFQQLEINEQKAQLQKEATQRYALWGGVGALAVLAFIFLRSYRIKKQDNELINQQKAEVEQQRDKIDEQHNLLHETHKEIKDSINYAKHLQDAILPSLDEISADLPNSFVLFNPKDVVSGDFYWHAKINEEQTLIAAADCTGHGVPGSLVSVVCSGALNRSVKEFGLKQPAEILSKTRELVVETFEKSGEIVRDGMDIALCLIKENSVVFCGANNPLWIVRQANLLTDEQLNARGTLVKNELALFEIAANRQPVGKAENLSPFVEHEVEIYKGDSLYLFSDGFADQFGEKTGKKFKKKPFKELLIQINSSSMNEQQNLLLKAFNSWKGNLEQIDDVCIIGVKI